MEIISFGFIVLTIISYGWLLKIIFSATTNTDWTTSRKNKFKIALLSSLAIWAAFVSIWSATGKMGNFALFPFNVMPVLVIPLIAILFFTFSKSTQSVIVQLEQSSLVALQSFRIFVEIFLWRLFVLNEMPIQMSFEGRNWDVLTGISALIVVYLIRSGRFSGTALVIWNLVGLALLLNIVSIAILSMPTPLRVFVNEPANTIVTQFPVSWLPALLVPLAYGLHFLSLRKLATDKKSS